MANKLLHAAEKKAFSLALDAVIKKANKHEAT